MSLFNLFFNKFSLHQIQGVALSILLFTGIQAFAQPYPNSYRMVDTWAKLPDGRTMGAVGDVTLDPDGLHIWAIVRCDATASERFGDECLDSDLDPVLKFDLEGNFIAQWTQFGRPSGVFFDEHDNIFVADSESDNMANPDWEMGIRIGDAHIGWVHYFIRVPHGDPRNKQGTGAEFVAVDKEGNLYGGEPTSRTLQKYVRVWR